MVFGEAFFFAGILFFGCAVLVATVLPVVDFAAFLDFAQRAFCAAAIFARASGLKVRTDFTFAGDFVGSSLVVLGRPTTPAGRPGFLLTVVVPAPAKSAFACCNREISASIWTTISFVFKVYPPVSRITYNGLRRPLGSKGGAEVTSTKMMLLKRICPRYGRKLCLIPFSWTL